MHGSEIFYLWTKNINQENNNNMVASMVGIRLPLDQENNPGWPHVRVGNLLPLEPGNNAGKTENTHDPLDPGYN
jgi:hypothetical protein